jgi:Na+/H+-dicarboxylate symporter
MLKKIPLYSQIVIALILAVGLGVLLGAGNPKLDRELIDHLAQPCTLILKALRTLATPLIFLAVIHTLMTAEIPSKSGRKLSILLITNTLVAIGIGLLVANLLRPGMNGNLGSISTTEKLTVKPLDPWGLLESLIPDAILKPLVDNNVLSLIFIALAFGIILRGLKADRIAKGQTDYQAIEQVVNILFEAIIKILH